MISLLLAVFTGALALSPPDEAFATNWPRLVIKRTPNELLTATDRHVRAATPRAQDLIAQGLRRSRILATLMTELESTDVIVHVELSRRLPPSLAGRLLLAIALPSGPRYLRIQIADEGSTNQQIAALAHELQHALEVASASEVRDERSLAGFYARVGTLEAPKGYDTAAAQVLGRRVLLEIGR